MAGPSDDALDSDPSKLEPSDPWRRLEQTFPTLSAAQVARVRALGEEVTFEAGEVIFRRGDRRVPFYLVLEGALEIVEHGDRVVTTHGPAQFSGELDLFNDRQTLVSGRAAEPTRVARLDRVAFKRLMNAEPDIGELITRALILRRVALIGHAQGGVTLVGHPRDAATLDLARFLERNGYPRELIDPERYEGELPPKCQHPAVLLPGGEVLSNPSRAALADVLGLTECIEPGHVHDVAVVGAGPAGLAAAVYAASEGLDTVVVESMAPGGQAGTSSRIENYLGFPTGISGQALAGRAQVQAQKFGARLVISRPVVGLRCEEESRTFRLVVEGGEELLARSVVVATGATYRKLALEGYAHFERRGIHYAATAMEADLCREEEVIVVGGGNSAGQAAVFLSRHAKRVYMLIRSGTLAESMSDYLIGRLEASDKIELAYHSEIEALHGDEFLSEVTWASRGGGRERRCVRNVFVMIGARPNTEWLDGCVELDERGFVITPPDSPLLFGTSRPGIVAVGDVRAGSVKRVASSVGEGSVVISGLHRYLAS